MGGGGWFMEGFIFGERKVSDEHLHIEMVNIQRDSVNFSFALPDERGGLCK